MSNGPYYQGDCECGAVTLIVTAEPLAQGRDEQGQGWLVLDAEAVQVSGGLEALENETLDDGCACSRCRHCRQRLFSEQEWLMLLPETLLPAAGPAPSDELARRLPWRLY
ncbi:hypothetical protein [Franzmannia qiaohouensis]|uniref:Uncharacterized protein n=1 Tax=Franzmannia qiaohouensis TaxID=1329370 RepID=A0ABU1H9L4_9GAMM|nr:MULTISPECIES: hypothetical protein [Halomonas]MDR5904149.1 hypothetical protein [Halomonas qiaohouensis]